MVTDSPVHTGVRLAFVKVDFAVHAHVAGMTQAGVLLNSVLAGSTVFARHRIAVINVILTVHAFKAGVGAVTLVSIYQVDTFSLVQTWRRQTLVCVDFAVHPLVTRHTLAQVHIVKILAGCAILARTGLAFIYVRQTPGTFKSWSTCTAVVVSDIATISSVMASRRIRKNVTVIILEFAVLSCEIFAALSTVAQEAKFCVIVVLTNAVV